MCKYSEIEKENYRRLLRAMFRQAASEGNKMENEADFEKYFPFRYKIFYDSMKALEDYYTSYVIELRDLGFDLFTYPSAEAVNFVENNIRRIFQDESDYIGYFIHTLKFGEKWEAGMVIEDGVEWELKNYRDLWKLLIHKIFQNFQKMCV